MWKLTPVKLSTACFLAALCLLLHPVEGNGKTLLPDQQIQISGSFGTRWLSIRQQDVKAGEYGVRSLITLPRLPVGAGLALQYLRFRINDYQKLPGFENLKEASGYSVSLDVRYWFSQSLIADYLTPWLHYSHEVFSDYKFIGKKDPSQDLKVSSGTEGYRFSLGVDLTLTEAISCFAEFSIGLQNIKNNYGSESERPGDKYAFDSRAGLAGIQVTL